MDRKKKFRALIEGNKWLKHVPNALTLCNSLCGFAAILNTLHVYDSPRMPDTVLAISAWIILSAMVFDALDGFAARIFNAASMHGIQMDSLADMVTFGVAPAVMVAIMAHYMRELKPGQYLVVWIFCAVYMGCAALRLATYNVHAILEKKSGSKFTGLPSPGAAAAICATVIFSSAHNYLSEMVAIVLPAIAAILGILMVSSVPYIHAGKLIASVRRNKKVLFFLFACAAGVVLYGAPTVMFIVVSAYILSGPLGWLFEKTGLFREAPKTPAADSPEK